MKKYMLARDEEGQRQLACTKTRQVCIVRSVQQHFI
jgi:hypothetical protein